MIEMLANGETRRLPSRDSYSHPTINGDVFAVERCGTFHEVRCRSYCKGRKIGDQLVATLETEREADALALFLSERVNSRTEVFYETD